MRGGGGGGHLGVECQVASPATLFPGAVPAPPLLECLESPSQQPPPLPFLWLPGVTLPTPSLPPETDIKRCPNITSQMVLPQTPSVCRSPFPCISLVFRM